MKNAVEKVQYLDKFTARKVQDDKTPLLATLPDSLDAWSNQYLHLAEIGVRSPAVTQKIALHLSRFLEYFRVVYGHDRISTCLKRDIVAWQKQMQTDGLAHSTINNHLASLSSFCTWVHSHAPQLFAAGDPSKGVGELGLPPLEPRALDQDQIRSLKNLCDRLDHFHFKKGRRQTGHQVQAHARPWRDRAIIYTLLSTGLRREEVIRLDLDQVEPQTPATLRTARKAKITRVKGKGKTERTVFLSADARNALADYLEKERSRDVTTSQIALFLTASSIAVRAPSGQLSLRALNLILEQIGRWHDAEQRDPARHISPLRPHDVRHTFAFQLAKATGADAYELERRLGHRSQRYIQRYTNPPEQVAATYIEGF
jgi:integrase